MSGATIPDAPQRETPWLTQGILNGITLIAMAVLNAWMIHSLAGLRIATAAKLYAAMVMMEIAWLAISVFLDRDRSPS